MAQRDLFDLLGPISPIAGAKPEPSLGGSVSFQHHDEDGENALPGFGQAQSRFKPRAPLGDAARVRGGVTRVGRLHAACGAAVAGSHARYCRNSTQ